ncbi:hypothetical protein [Natronorarus salvus]|uniref:hypothetical protein n=1 Tax=Natronorarus salvus TaxID=3117733 RepID=UPI002F25F8D6
MNGDEYDHPLLGVNRGYTLVGFLYLILGGIVAVADPVHTSGVSSAAELLVPASLVVPFLYAVSNGGPLLAFLLSQQTLGAMYLLDLLTGGATVDPVAPLIALMVGAGAAGVAVYATGVHRTRQVRVPVYEGYRANLLFASVCYLGAAVVLWTTWDHWRVLRGAIPLFEVIDGMFLVSGCLVIAYWPIWIRTLNPAGSV